MRRPAPTGFQGRLKRLAARGDETERASTSIARRAYRTAPPRPSGGGAATASSSSELTRSGGVVLRVTRDALSGPISLEDEPAFSS
jgi:hypothetical protein